MNTAFRCLAAYAGRYYYPQKDCKDAIFFAVIMVKEDY